MVIPKRSMNEKFGLECRICILMWDNESWSYTFNGFMDALELDKFIASG